jgi:superfamily II DNA helicase RecQ
MLSIATSINPCHADPKDCDRISDVLLIARQLRRWMGVENAKQIVVPYHSELSEEMKGRVSQEFVRSESIHRIVVATDAMGMGINNPDIIHVVNWKQSLESFTDLV